MSLQINTLIKRHVNCFSSGKDKHNSLAKENTDLFQTDTPITNKFNLRFSVLESISPVILIIHCNGDILNSSCLLLHDAFSMCFKNKLSFIIVDMSNVTAIDNRVWEYFSSKTIKIQRLNGILLFSSIHDSLINNNPDFKRYNICYYNDIDTCRLAIKLLTFDHEKVISVNKDFKGQLEISNSIYNQQVVITTDTDEEAITDKIHSIIISNGPCRVNKILKLLATPEYGGKKISRFKILKLLKEMNIDSPQKMVRYYRSF